MPYLQLKLNKSIKEQLKKEKQKTGLTMNILINLILKAYFDNENPQKLINEFSITETITKQKQIEEKEKNNKTNST
jgi:antitoxin component of RelBE/YafQ-DinJ toxin-antitoxin module